MDLKEKIDPGKLPIHIAIIMDGNGRWAKQRGKSRVHGHRAGVKSVREVTEAAAELGIRYLTLYAFSTENWLRPKREVSALMNLLVDTIRKETKKLMDNNIRLRAIGDIQSLPDRCNKNLQEAMAITANNDRMDLILALSYSSRWEILKAVNRILDDYRAGKLKSLPVDQNTFTSYLETADIPDPELMIRTSGEKRISNFLLWQLAYTELYFTDILWPDFDRQAFYQAIIDFQHRERRFGKISEQIKSS